MLKWKPTARAAPPSSVHLGSKDSTRRHGHRWWRAQTQPTERETKQRLFLRGLEEMGILFYSLSAEEMIHGELAAVTWRSQTLMATRGLVRASPIPRSSPKASPLSPQDSLWFNCFGQQWIELVRWLSSCTRVWGLGDKIQQAWVAIYRAFGTNS
jgi:hypothetical protein